MARFDCIAVYIVTNQRNGTLYIGVTSDLERRAFEHREGIIPGFAAKYGCKMLVWFETHEQLHTAFHRETQLKGWKRAWKIALIQERNPQWRDLSDDFLAPPPPTFLDN